MLTTIYLTGELGHKFGRKWKLAVSSPAEAIRAIEANKPGLLDYLVGSGDRGVDFRVKVDGEVIEEKNLRFKRRGSTIRISPVVRGAKDKTTGIIIGVVLVVVAIVAQAYGAVPGILSGAGSAAAGGANAGLFGGWLGTFVGALGVSMAIGGIAQMLAPQPGISSDSGSEKPSYLFQGPVNSVQQGGPVPICYGGPIIVGSQVVSAGIYSEDISAVLRGVVDEGPFNTDPDYPPYSGPTAPTNLIARSIQTRQKARFLDAICEGKIAGLCDKDGNILSYDDRNKGIFFEATQVQDDAGAPAFNEFSTAFRPGSVSQDPIPGFPLAESESAVETEVIKGSDKYANAIQRTISPGTHNAIRVSIRIPALFRIDAKGNRTGNQVHFGVHIKRSVDSTWNEVVGSNALPNGELDGLIQGEATDPAVIDFRIPLPGVGPWDVRVLKETADSVDPTHDQSRVFWQSYALITDGKFTYRHTALIGSELSALKFSTVPARWFRIKGKLIRVPSNYNPVTRNYSGTWDGKFAGADIVVAAGYTAYSDLITVNALAAALPIDSPVEIEQGGIVSHAFLMNPADVGATVLNITPINRNLTSGATGYGFDLKWTNNPAWILNDFLVEKRYGLGDYIPRGHADIWALYTIARYCDGVDGSGNFVGVDDGRGGVEPRFALTTYIQGTQDAYRVIADIASAFRGMIYYGAGVISGVQDAPKSPRFNFHEGNVIDGMFQYSNTALKARHTRVRVQFADPDNFYKADIETVDADDADLDTYGIRETSITGFGCASRGQARRLGKWLLYTEKLEKETVIFRTGMQGARARPGDIIRVRDRFKTVNVMAGRLMAVGVGSITLDTPVVIGAGGTYTVIATKTDGTFADLTVTNTAGTYNVLTVTGALTDVVPSADWILRTSTLEPVLFRTLDVKEFERHIFEITALRYAESKFAAVESGIVITDPPTSDLPSPETPLSPASITIELSLVETPSLSATWEASLSLFVDGYIVEYRAPGSEWKEIEARARGLSCKPVLVGVAGEHSFRVFTVNTLGFISTPPVQGSITVTGAELASAGFSVLLSSEAHTVACANDGTVNGGQLGSGSTANTTVSVIKNTDLLTAVASSPGAGQFAISIGTLTNATATKEANDRIRCDSLTADTGTIEILVDVAGAFTVSKTFTLTKSKSGATGTNGSSGSPVFIFQRATSAPALPSATATYTFATGGLTGLNNGWSATIPSGTDPVWISSAIASSTGTTDTIGAGEWSTARKLAEQGPTGPDGLPGPGLVYRGEYSSSQYYYHTTTRRDVVSVSGTYWLVNNLTKNALNTWGTPGVADWAAFGAVFSSVATGLLLAEDATITKTLTIGTAGSDHGSLQSANWSSGSAGWHFTDTAVEINSGTITLGTGANRVNASSSGTNFGDPSGLHFKIASYAGADVGIQLYDGASLRAFWSTNSGVVTLDLGTSSSDFSCFQARAQNVRAFATLNDGTSDVPLVSYGGAYVVGTVTAGGFNKISARRFKKNVRTITGALDTLKALRGVKFDWRKSHKEKAGLKHDIGFIAEEVARVIPSLVTHDPKGQAVGVDYATVTALLVQAVKELSAKVDALGIQNKRRNRS